MDKLDTVGIEVVSFLVGSNMLQDKLVALFTLILAI